MSDDNLVLEDEIADEPMFSDEELKEDTAISDTQANNSEESLDLHESDEKEISVTQSDFEENVAEVEEETQEEEVLSEEAALEAQAQWFTLQCFSLQEHKVAHRIRQMMEVEFKNSVFQVLLPEEETVEIKNNKRHERMTKIYPGYIFVKSLPQEDVWFLLKQIPGVTKVIGSKTLPTPIASAEMDKILRQMGDKTKKIEVDFEVDEVIRVVSGPFRGYSGVISEINSDRGKLKALISIFGRETPVELDFDQVEQAVGS